jgi:hypothetical protein
MGSSSANLPVSLTRSILVMAFLAKG